MSEPEPRPLVSSRDNPLFQRLRRLMGDASAYRREGQFCIEGEHLCSAFLDRGQRPALAVLSESAWQQPRLRQLIQPGQAVQRLTDRLFEQLSALPSPAGVAFLVDLPAASQPDVDEAAVWLDRLQDPGNVGSILRSASAMGVRQVWATPGTAALWSPKVLRAAMGAHFSLQLCEGVTPAELASGRAAWVATSSHARTVLGQIPLPMPCVWIFGNEGQGVDASLLSRCALTVRIPQPGGEESLNVASVDQPVRPDVAQDGGGDLLDRLVRR